MRNLTICILFFAFNASLLAQSKVISGRIIDESGRPLPNVSIILERTKRATISNAQGQYSIISSYESDKLTASHIGYTSKTVSINRQTGVLNIRLESAEIELGDVIITNRTADEIFKKAVDKIPINYLQEDFLVEIFYRAKSYHTADSIVFAEETSFQQIKSYRKNSEDKLFLLKNRNFNFNEKPHRIIGQGVFDPVKMAQERRFSRDKFKFLPATLYDGKYLYVLGINEDSEKEKALRGKVYIDADDLAFVRFELLDSYGERVAQYKKIDNKYYLLSSNLSHTNRRTNGGVYEVSDLAP